MSLRPYTVLTSNLSAPFSERLTRLVPNAPRSDNTAPGGPTKITAEGIINAYKRACGELSDPPPLDPHSPAAAIVRAYRKACGEEPDEPNRLPAPPVKVTAVAPVTECQEETEHDE